MTVAEKLKTARADLAALERHTAKLEGNVSAQTAELDRIRREARSGSADFEAVVDQQARVTAAEGLLSMHLQDVANTAALIDELQAALTLEDLIDEGKRARAEAAQVAQDHAQLAAELEAQIGAGLERLNALQRAYSSAQARTWAAGQEHTARALGMTAGDVSQVVTRPDRGLTGEAGRVQQQRVTTSLEDFAAQIGSNPRTLRAVALRSLPTLAAGPLLGMVNRA